MRSLFTAVALALLIGVSATGSEAAIIGISESAFGPGSTVVTFSEAEVPLGTNIDGLTIGNSTFDWNGTGTVNVLDTGPLDTNNITQPSLLSDSSIGVLTISLSNYVNLLGYGYAIVVLDQDGLPILDISVPNATTISLFDNATALGSLSFTGVPDPAFPGGFAGVFSDVAFNRVELTFSAQAAAFDIDNLRTAVDAQAAPEPATVLLLGTGLVGAGVRRWRRARA